MRGRECLLLSAGELHHDHVLGDQVEQPYSGQPISSRVVISGRSDKLDLIGIGVRTSLCQHSAIILLDKHSMNRIWHVLHRIELVVVTGAWLEIVTFMPWHKAFTLP